MNVIALPAWGGDSQYTCREVWRHRSGERGQQKVNLPSPLDDTTPPIGSEGSGHSRGCFSLTFQGLRFSQPGPDLRIAGLPALTLSLELLPKDLQFLIIPLQGTNTT